MRVNEAKNDNNSGEVIALRDPRSLSEGYMDYNLEAGAGRNDSLKLKMSFRPDRPGAEREASLSLDLKANAFDTMRYSRGGSTGNVGYHNNGAGAGVLALVADKNKGIVALDIEAAKIVSGGDPSMKELRNLKQLAQDPKLRAFAKAGGINLDKLQVQVDDIKISAAFRDKSQHTVAIDVTLTDGRVTQKGEFSAVLRGDLARGPAALTMSRFEPGVASSAGWLYRPSDLPGSRDVFVRG